MPQYGPNGRPGGGDESGTPGAGEANVQADWTEADARDDAYIRHKPDILALQRQIDSLRLLLTDFHAGQPATGWANASNDAQGGIALGAAPWTLTAIKAHKTWIRTTDKAAGKYGGLRIPASAKRAQAQVVIAGASGAAYNQPLTMLVLLGSDGGWAYYREVAPDGAAVPYGGTVTRVTLQVTGSLAHIGASEYVGHLAQAYSESDIAIAGGAGANNVAIPARACKLVIVWTRGNLAGSRWIQYIPISLIRDQATGNSGKLTYKADSFNPAVSAIADEKAIALTATRNNNGTISIARAAAAFSIVQAFFQVAG